MTTRAQIVATAREYLGTPFHHQASKKKAGCDCIGLLRGVGRDLALPGSVELEASTHLLAYGPDPDPALLRECERFLLKITWAELDLGDVLMMKTMYSRGQPKHFAIVSRLDPVYIIHAWAYGKAQVIENRLDDRWRRFVLGCYRFKGLMDG